VAVRIGRGKLDQGVFVEEEVRRRNPEGRIERAEKGKVT
jgi:hypothetical protein